MKIMAISDTHGNLPDISPCDLLLHGGDICPGGYKEPILNQLKWINGPFREWLEDIPAKHVVMVPGNHDWLFEPQNQVILPNLRWHLLIDNLATIYGLKIYGTPWQLPYGYWAFNAEEKDLERKYRYIPDDIDILISHGPPFGFGDKVIETGFNGKEWFEYQRGVGSKSLMERILQIKPKLTVVGHIHEDRGIWETEGIVIANCSHVDVTYRKRFPPMEFNLVEGKLSYLGDTSRG